MKKIFLLLSSVLLVSLLTLTSCTPLVVCGAAAGGAYLGYKAAEEGYTIQITKPVKGTKSNTPKNKNSNTSSK